MKTKTNHRTSQPTDRQTGSGESFTSNDLASEALGVPDVVQRFHRLVCDWSKQDIILVCDWSIQVSFLSVIGLNRISYLSVIGLSIKSIILLCDWSKQNTIHIYVITKHVFFVFMIGLKSKLFLYIYDWSKWDIILDWPKLLILYLSVYNTRIVLVKCNIILVLNWFTKDSILVCDFLAVCASENMSLILMLMLSGLLV